MPRRFPNVLPLLICLIGFAVVNSAPHPVAAAPPTTGKPLSRLGQYCSQKGRLLGIDRKTIGTVAAGQSGDSGIDVLGIVTSGMTASGGTSTPIRGVALHFSGVTTQGEARAYTVMVDPEEATRLAQALRLMATQGAALQGKSSGENYLAFDGTEAYHFRFQHALADDPKFQRFSARAGTAPEITLDFTSPDRFQKLAQMIKDGLTWSARQEPPGINVTSTGTSVAPGIK